MKRLTILTILSLALTACPRIPPHEPILSCFDIYIKDIAGVDLIKKNLAEFDPEIKTTPWFVLLPPEFYDARISVNGKDIGAVTLRMYYTDIKYPYHLWYACDLQEYYNRAGRPEIGTVIYTLTFPLLFGDDRTLQIEADWRVVPVESKSGGNELWYDKITVNGEPIPVPGSNSLSLII